MGQGYWVLVWDGFGAGLVMINPRMITEGLDMYKNPNNWFPCNDKMSDEDIIEKHQLDKLYKHFRIIR